MRNDIPRSFLGLIPLKTTHQMRQRAEKGVNLGLLSLDDYLQAVVSIEPLVDVATEKKRELGKSVIRLLINRSDDLAIGILDKMIEDQEESVRFFASIAFDIIDGHFRCEIKQLKEDIEEEDTIDKHARLGAVLMKFIQLRVKNKIIRGYYLDKAIAEFDKVLKVDEKNPEVLFYKAKAFDWKGKTEQALELYRQLVYYSPNHCGARYEVAKIEYQKGSVQEVKEQCRAISAIGTDNEEILASVMFWTKENE